jgi:hypothetical protein
MVTTTLDIVEERMSSYGHPLENFRAVAELWNVYLNARGFAESAALSPEDIAYMMILFKVARTIHSAEYRQDTIDDIAGYAKCITLIREKQNG